MRVLFRKTEKHIYRPLHSDTKSYLTPYFLKTFNQSKIYTLTYKSKKKKTHRQFASYF